MDRRTTLKWMLAASAAWPLARSGAAAVADRVAKAPGEAKPYGTDANLIETYHPGALWPLTFTAAQRALATVLCDVIIPADATSPSASSVGVVDFIDEWVSAPYSPQRDDRKLVLDGFEWFDGESSRRFSKQAAALDAGRLQAICDDICYLPRAKPNFIEAAKFFARLRDLTAGGFYTTPVGRKDLQYIGNIPLAKFDGPPIEVLRKAGLA